MSHGPRLQSNWDWRAAGNFILGGSGTGLMICAAALGFIQDTALLAPIAAALVSLGLLLVWMEIGRPLRAFNVLRNPGSSWMSREAWLGMALIALSPLVWFSGSQGVLVADAIAAALFLFAQARILNAATGTPAWRSREIPYLIVCCGLSEGGALLLLLSRTGATESPGAAVEWSLLLLLASLRGIVWARYWQQLNQGAPSGTLLALQPVNLILMLAGTLLPFLLGFISLLPGAAPLPLLPLTALALLLSGWHFKYVLVVKAAYSQGFAVAHAPARGSGTPGPGIKSGWTLPR